MPIHDLSPIKTIYNNKNIYIHQYSNMPSHDLSPVMTFVTIRIFPVWHRVRVISTGYEPVLDHTEKFVIKIIRSKPVLLAPRG